MRLLVFFFVALLCGNLSSQQKISNSQIERINLCNWYSQNYSWLPDAFLQNAACVCASTPDEPKANTIRLSLMKYFNETPDSIKLLSANEKKLYQNHKINKRKYKIFVHKNLVPLIYQYHKKAYSDAGCLSKPAKYWQWKIASTYKFKNCKFLWFRIQCFGGSCYGKFCKW